jgi:hypothetical protein
MDDLEFRIAKLELKPGDILVVKIDAHLSDTNRAVLRAQWEPLIPGGHKMLILDRSIELSVLTQSDIEARAV